ncbi:3-deoxy-D-manno-octulosonic acid transferase [Bordetella flabilis]|uniref:3-deoxy-D-manno-octulosonic acid transferase n=1 Tax=Bordetella flabilis TaxID=463014 RepID=A0A193GJ89_9BORD|nr:3-deoxy-D-manno-octulosonic acid transferase [Bordetella flabilis]ANN79910.1 3-deoxy-D-manno-octulosonic acid transferase [Bordetella flabilis]
MSRVVYTALLRLFAPVIWLWMRVRAGRYVVDWQILRMSRFGIYQAVASKSRTVGPVWIHAVSLGETRAAQPLIQALLDEGLPVLLTHTTPTGRAEGGRLFGTAMASGQLRQTWLPYDFPGSVRRFLKHYVPRCGILIEREVWPNLIHEAHRAGVPMALVSARLSDQGFRRSRWARRALHGAYGALHLVLAQTEADADRLRQLGALEPHVMGNLKFDIALPSNQMDAGRQWKQSLVRPTIAVASTRDGEEEMFATAILNADQSVPARVLHMLIPRHPQRFGNVATILQQHGLTFVRRSAGAEMLLPEMPVLLGDTLGEMAFYYAAADVAIIGGGFAPLGGQNLIEACAAGTPVIVGPHMHNFVQATQDAIAAGAAIQVKDAAQALHTSYDLLRDAHRLGTMREAALAWTAAHTGATARILQALRPLLRHSTERPEVPRCRL